MSEAILQTGKKVPLGVKIGYSIGTAGDSIPYNLFFTYFLFFLTDVAGVSPAIAGVISMIAVLWDAVTDPVVGYLSDNSTNPKGRRRPWIFRTVWPYAIVVFLLFVPNEFQGTAQIVYYILMSVLLWTFYTTYSVPWASLGAEITRDYNERNTIRMITGLCAYPFVALCNSGPMWIQAALIPAGWSVKACWGLAAGIGAIIMTICVLISWAVTKGREEDPTELQREMANQKKESLVKVYKELFQQKAYRNLIFTGIFYIIGYTLFSSVGVYMMTYCANMNPVQQGAFWSFYTIVAIICTPISIIIANKIGSKKIVLFLFSLGYALTLIVFFFLGDKSFTQHMILGVLIALTTSAFWGQYYSMVYDCSEVDYLLHGKHREGSVVACAQFIQKLGGALATSGTGWILAAFHYSGTGVETPEAIKGILSTGTIIPAVFILISCAFMFKFPINKKNHDLLRAAIAKKDAGEEWSKEGIEELL